MPRIHPTADIAASAQIGEGAGYFLCPKTGARYLECDTDTLVEVD